MCMVVDAWVEAQMVVCPAVGTQRKYKLDGRRVYFARLWRHAHRVIRYQSCTAGLKGPNCSAGHTRLIGRRLAVDCELETRPVRDAQRTLLRDRPPPEHRPADSREKRGSQ